MGATFHLEIMKRVCIVIKAMCRKRTLFMNMLHHLSIDIFLRNARLHIDLEAEAVRVFYSNRGFASKKKEGIKTR